MPVQLASIYNELYPGLRGLTGRYQLIPKQYPRIFKTYKSEMAVERTTEMRYLPPAQLKTEGASTFFDNRAGERFVYNQAHNEISIGYAITRPAIDDNLYKAQFNPSNLGLMDAHNQTKEDYAASVFNLGNVYQTQIAGDGQPLFSTAHPIDGGSYANRPSVDADLAETSLLSAMIAIRTQFVNQAGIKMYARARMGVSAPQLEPVWIRLLHSELRPGTADNDVNAIRTTTGGLKEDYFINDYFTSPQAWFLLTDKPGLAYMERIPYEMSMEVDFTTDNLLVKGYERYSFSYFDPRCSYGSFPTS